MESAPSGAFFVGVKSVSVGGSICVQPMNAERGREMHKTLMFAVLTIGGLHGIMMLS